MTTTQIKCSRCSALLGSTVTDGPATGYFCQACLAWRERNAVESTTDPDRCVLIREDGRVQCVAIRRLEGAIVGDRQIATTTQAALSPAERTALKALLVKLWQAAT